MANERQMDDGSLSLEQMGKLAQKSVEVAHDAWWSNFKSGYNSGDNNREAIGRLSGIILAYYLDKVNADFVENIELNPVRLRGSE